MGPSSEVNKSWAQKINNKGRPDPKDQVGALARGPVWMGTGAGASVGAPGGSIPIGVDSART